MDQKAKQDVAAEIKELTKKCETLEAERDKYHTSYQEASREIAEIRVKADTFQKMYQTLLEQMPPEESLRQQNEMANDLTNTEIHLMLEVSDLRMKIKDNRLETEIKTKKIDELASEIINYKHELGLPPGATEQQTEEKIRYLMKKDKPGSHLREVMDLLKAARTEITELEQGVVKLDHEHTDLEKQFMKKKSQHEGTKEILHSLGMFTYVYIILITNLLMICII